MDNLDTLTIQVSRCSPGEKATPRYTTYEIPEATGMSVMDVLRYIQGDIDPTLAFDCSCRIGICKACALRVNGEVVMACSTAAKDGMKIDPVNTKGIKRDLVVRPAKAPASVSSIAEELARRGAGE